MHDKLKSRELIFTVLFILIYLALAVKVFDWIIDDLYIYFRYVDNFTKGNGIVFNTGERVEGFSSFSWFLILSLIKSAGLPLEMTSKLAGIMFAFAGAACLYFICKGSGLSKYYLPALCLMVFNLPFILWSVSGFEIMMFIFLLLMSFLMIIRITSDSGFSAFLVSLIFLISVSRPEGVIFSAGMLCFIYIFSMNRKLLLKYAAVYGLLFISFLTFRFVYFGDLLPNTYYAKIGHNIVGYYEFRTYKNGIFYFLYFLRYNPQFILFFLLLPLVFRKLISNKIFLFAAAMFLLQFIFIVFSGGDWMVQYRFAVVSVPFLSVCTVFCLRELISSDKIKLSLSYTLVSVVFITSALSIIFADRTIIKKEIVLWNNLKKESAEIKKDIPPGSLVANGSSGIIPYYLDDVKFIDIVGITNRHIARDGYRHGTWFERSLPDYVYSLDPEWIIMWKKKNSDGIYTFQDASPCYIDMAVNENFSKYSFYKDYDLYSDVKIELYKRKEAE
ncbi:MAG: hypothetical protein JSS91_01885 [Bacteroidetes bacterium]|nr:hypothetical protein [Bacteroidota bacterium]